MPLCFAQSSLAVEIAQSLDDWTPLDPEHSEAHALQRDTGDGWEGSLPGFFPQLDMQTWNDAETVQAL